MKTDFPTELFKAKPDKNPQAGTEKNSQTPVYNKNRSGNSFETVYIKNKNNNAKRTDQSGFTNIHQIIEACISPHTSV